MSQKIFFTELPEPVVILKSPEGDLLVELSLHPEAKDVTVTDEDGNTEVVHGWECDTHKFKVSHSEYTEDDILANPEAFLSIDPVADAALKGAIIDAVQERMDAEAQAHGYDNILSAVSYAGDAHPVYGPEGDRCKAWRSECWQYCLQLLDDVKHGRRPRPTIQEVLAGLPNAQWPTH